MPLRSGGPGACAEAMLDLVDDDAAAEGPAPSPSTCVGTQRRSAGPVHGHDGGQAAAHVQVEDGDVPLRASVGGRRCDGEGQELAVLGLRPASKDEGGLPLAAPSTGTKGLRGSSLRGPGPAYNPRGRGGSIPSPLASGHARGRSPRGRLVRGAQAPVTGETNNNFTPTTCFVWVSGVGDSAALQRRPRLPHSSRRAPRGQCPARTATPR